MKNEESCNRNWVWTLRNRLRRHFFCPAVLQESTTRRRPSSWTGGESSCSSGMKTQGNNWLFFSSRPHSVWAAAELRNSRAEEVPVRSKNKQQACEAALTGWRAFFFRWRSLRLRSGSCCMMFSFDLKGIHLNGLFTTDLSSLCCQLRNTFSHWFQLWGKKIMYKWQIHQHGAH